MGVTVADLDGRLELVVADRGSNEVTILLNQATADGGFSWCREKRLNVETETEQGIGSVETAIVRSTKGGEERVAVRVSG